MYNTCLIGKRHSLELHAVQKGIEQSKILKIQDSKEAFKAQLRAIEPITTLKPGQLAHTLSVLKT
jgi:hypothetical protein